MFSFFFRKLFKIISFQVIAEKESGCLRCHAAAEGLDISFMSDKKNIFD